MRGESDVFSGGLSGGFKTQNFPKLGEIEEEEDEGKEDSYERESELVTDQQLSDLASLLASTGGSSTKLPTLESLNAEALNIHRKNWKRRRPHGLN